MGWSILLSHNGGEDHVVTISAKDYNIEKNKKTNENLRQLGFSLSTASVKPQLNGQSRPY